MELYWNLRFATAVVVLTSFGFFADPALAEDDPDDALRLEEITVSAPRLETPLYRVPGATGVVGKEDIQRARQGIELDAALDAMPGVFIQNRYNFAQDLRISIRGAGARAPFGIRGVKILVDGIPATLPDGQASIDAIDLNTLERVEVMRGPSSALYGNASGGVISMTTESGTATPYLEGRSTFGSDGYNKTTVKGGGRSGNVANFGSISHLDYAGFRDHSATEATKFNGKVEYDLAGGARLTGVVGMVDSPQAQDPGALTEEQVEADRDQAAPGNLQFDAGEEIDEQRLGAVYERPLGGHHQIRLRGYSTWRDFANRLPFTDGGMVQFDRHFIGGGALYTYDAPVMSLDNRLMAGVDVERQRDDRQRYDNQNGEQGPLVFDQVETVSNVGLFVQNETGLTDRLTMTVGARYDRIEFDVDDAYFDDGADNSGSRSMSEISPRVGLSYRWTPAFIPYANVSRSFETPTTTELARCDGGGLRDSLDPQTATNYELGANGEPMAGLRYNVALYSIDGGEEIVPIGCPGQPGRDYFVNAGQTRRNGLELGLDAVLTDALELRMAYTYSDFEFDSFATDGERFDGNTIPGIPAHTAYGELKYRHPSGLFAAGDVQYAGAFYADNANDVRTDSYVVSGLRAGWTRSVQRWDFTAFGGINNALDEAYNENVRLNAFGGRYFEPAPGRNYYGGVQVRYNVRR